MSSTEKILVNIFERKNSIIEQIKQQSQSFDHYLASMCILQGLQVPPWIFSNEDSNEFKKEDIISGLLLPCPQPSVIFSGSISRYGEPTVSTFDRNYAGNRLSVAPQFAPEDPCTSSAAEEDVSVSCYSRMPTVMIDDGIGEGNRLSVIPQFSNEATCSSRAAEELDVSVSLRMPTVVDGFNACSRLSVIPQSADEAPCTSCAAEELGISVSSPLERGGVENNDQGHVQSLVRIQRSKSRQKALELRNSVKAVKNSLQKEDNLDGFCRRIEGSGVVSLRYDHADEAELCQPVNAENETCIEEAAKAGEFGNCGPQVDLLIEQCNADDPTNIAKEDGFVVSSNKSTEPNNFTVLLQPFNSSVYAANCAAEEIGTGDCRDNKQNCIINFSGIRRFETSGGLLSSVKEPCNVSKSCHGANKARYESIARSVEQPSFVDGWLQSDKPSSAVGGKSSRVEEVKHGTKQSNENDTSTYIGRITRSRSCRQKPILVSDHLNLGGSNSNAHKGGDERTKVTTYAPSLSHFDINSESSNLKANTFGSESKKEEVSDGGSSRSRSCAKSIKCTSECLNLDCLSGKNNRGSVRKVKQLFNPVDGSMTVIEGMTMADRSCGEEGRVLDVKNIDDETDTSSGRINAYRSSGHQPVNLEQLPMEENASNVDKPKCSDVRQLSCSSQEEAADFQKALGSGQNILPFTECSNFVDLARDNVAVMETEIDCAKRVQAYPIVSGPASVECSPGLEYDVIVADSDIESAGQGDPCSLNSDSSPGGAGLGMETLDSMPSAERALLMKPKELHFDDGQNFCLTETCNLELESKEKNTPPEMQSSIPHPIPDNMKSVNYEEKSTSFAEMQQELSEREKLKNTPFEVHLENSAKLVHNKSFNSEPKNVDASHFENQIADSCFKDSWSCYKEVQNGGEFSKELSAPVSVIIKPFQCNQIERDVVQSTKDEGKHQNAQLYITNQPDLITRNLKAKKDQRCFEVMDRSASVSLLNEHLEAFSVSSPTEPVADWVSQALLTRTGEEANRISRALKASVQDVAEENKAHLQFEDKFEPRSTEPLIDSVGTDVEGSRNLSCISALSPHNESQILIGIDQNIPELEGFVMGTEDIVNNGVDFANVGYPSTGIKRASLLEQLYKSACLHTPLSHLSTTLGLHKKLSLYQSTPAGLLEGLKTMNTPTANADISMQFEASFNDEHNFVFPGSSSSDCLPSSSSQYSWDIKNPFVSPVGEFWNGITSKSGSSGKRLSSNHELPSISEENECTDEMAKTFQEDIVTEDDRSVKRDPLADITKILNPLLPVCESEVLEDRCSVASVNQKHYRGSHVSRSENARLLRSNVKRANGSLNSKAQLSEKLSLRRENSNIHKKDSKRNNIVSNITSFIPLVQKQADANITGKRDVKVKSLEAAEVARRKLEKMENDRKMRKEALQRERAQKEQENLKQMELDKEKKEEERKKKLADNAAKKRQREEEEKKERERKRKCVEEKRRQLAEEEEKKLRDKKENKELKSRAAEKKAFENKEPRYKLQKHENMEKAKGDNILVKVPETEPTVASTKVIGEISTVVRSSEELSACGEKLQVMSHAFEAIQDNNLDLNEIEEKSYEISPYKSSDDEDDDEEEDDLQKSKFIPSWCSKNHLATIVASQQKIDPESIFSLESFCNITEVLLPRRLLQNVAAK